MRAIAIACAIGGLALLGVLDLNAGRVTTGAASLLFAVGNFLLLRGPA